MNDKAPSVSPDDHLGAAARRTPPPPSGTSDGARSGSPDDHLGAAARRRPPTLGPTMSDARRPRSGVAGNECGAPPRGPVAAVARSGGASSRADSGLRRGSDICGLSGLGVGR
jgi:hypothetical protein